MIKRPKITMTKTFSFNKSFIDRLHVLSKLSGVPMGYILERAAIDKHPELRQELILTVAKKPKVKPGKTSTKGTIKTNN